MERIRDRTRQVYETHAVAWDRHRSRFLYERAWIDRFLDGTPPDTEILDLGCGAGEPIAGYLIERGCAVCGVDFAEPMLSIARLRFPDARWINADMRRLELAERFGGIVAWDSFFHLDKDEQRSMLPRLARHLAPGGSLLLTVGPGENETSGMVEGEIVYHASLSLEEYASRLDATGLDVVDFVPEDPGCDFHSVLLATTRG